MLIAVQDSSAKALLDKFERVVGIEWDKFAIAAAKENALRKRPTSRYVEEELYRSDGFSRRLWDATDGKDVVR